MKNKKIFVIALVSFLMLALTGFGVTSFVPGRVHAEDVTLNASPLQSSYTLGTKLSVPQGKLTYDGKEYDADAVVHFPDGNAFLSETVTLDQTGIYTLEYRKVADGKLLRKTKTFEVLEGLYTVTSERSTMRYGKPSELGIPFTTEESPTGLCVSLANGDKFDYNAVIDLNEISKDNKALQFYLTPWRSKTADAFSVFVKFTDIYDPDNYVIVSIWSYDRKSYNDSPCRAAYITTCVPTIGQSYTGHYSTYQKGGNGWRDYIFKSMRTSGFCSFVSFYGDNANGEVRWIDGTPGGEGFTVDWGYAGYRQIGFWWDYANRQLWSNQPLPQFSELVADYDDPNYYNSLWGGMTTGECYVSLWAEDYNNSTFNFVITEMNGEDLTTKAPATEYRDTDKPVITVNYGDYSENTYPDALVGSEYTVFAASAFDGYDGATDVSVRAFNNYGAANCYEVSCGKTFKPDRAGEYTLVYTAKDKAGNVAEKTVKITAKEQAASVVTLSVDSSAAAKNFKAGEFAKVASATYSGGVGKLEFNVTAYGKKTGTGYVIENNSFRPMVADTYRIVYSVSDFIGQTVTSEYEITVAENDGPMFENIPNLPKYLISGYSYQLPEGTAKDKSGKAVKAEIILRDNGAETSAVAGVMNIAGDTRTVELIYRATANGKTSELRFERQVIKPLKGVSIDLAKYFAGTGFTAVSDSDMVTITANAQSATAEFINAVLAEGFTAQYKVIKDGFNEFALYLTDSEDAAQRIKLSWKNADGVTFTYLNDKITSASTTFDFNGTESNFIWHNETHTFYDNSTDLSVEVNETIYGAAFTGFTSGKLYAEFVMNGVTGEASVGVTKINNQTIRLTRRDVITPQISVIGSYLTNAVVGDRIEIRKAVAADVISPVTTLSVTVTDPDGNYVKTTDGRELKNDMLLTGAFVIEKTGAYKVVYNFSDGTKEADEPATINCTKVSVVKIELSADAPATAKVGDTVTMPEAKVTAETASSYYVLVINPKGVITNITSTRSFKAELNGVYKVVYTAYDSDGNVCTVYYDVKVG